MFKAIIHNAEYGPVDLETLQRWAKERRIQPETFIVDIETGERLPSYRLPALQSIYSENAVPPPVSTPSAPAAAPAPPPEEYREPARIFSLPMQWPASVWAVGVAIMVLLLLAFGMVVRYQNEADRQEQSVENLGRLNTALDSYAQANEGRYPVMNSPEQVKQALIPYLPPRSDYVFISPVTNEPYQPNPALSGRRRDEIDIRSLSALATFYERKVERERQRALVAFADGTVRRVARPEWASLNIGNMQPVATSQSVPGGRWVQVMQQTGNRSTTTQPFVIVGPRWRVKYDVGGDSTERRFKVLAHKSPAQFETLVDLRSDAGKSSFAEQPGEFYLSIDTDQSFSVTVEQFLPDGFVAPVQTPVNPETGNASTAVAQ